MPILKRILMLPFAGVAVGMMLAVLSAPASLQAQTIPSDAQPTCTVTLGQFASWFQTGTPSQNGVVKPADSLNFPDQPNCTFYQWADQMFLWLTSPAPSTYCGGSAHVFDSPAFFDVSVPDSTGKRTFIAHECSPLGGIRRSLNLRSAQVGSHGLPVIFDKAGRMLEVEDPPTGPTGKPLIFSRSGVSAEVERVNLGSDGKPIFWTSRANRSQGPGPSFILACWRRQSRKLRSFRSS